MQEALAQSDMDLPDAPAHWGDMRQHMFWGALYHWFVLTGFWDYRNFRPHRALTVRQEFLLYLQAPGPDALSPAGTLLSPPSASGTAAFPITWCSCNWNMTPVSRCIRPSPR